VDQKEIIRREYFLNRKSMREIAKELHHGRTTIRKAIYDCELAIAITARLERELPEEILREIKDATVAVGEIDIFEPNRSPVRRLKPVIPSSLSNATNRSTGTVP